MAVNLGARQLCASLILKGLMQAGLVTCRRESRNLYYSPNMKRMNELVGYLTENCCNLADTACDSNCQPVAEAPKRKSA